MKMVHGKLGGIFRQQKNKHKRKFLSETSPSNQKKYQNNLLPKTPKPPFLIMQVFWMQVIEKSLACEKNVGKILMIN